MWPIYLINLDRSPGRLEKCEALFDSAGLAYQRFPACDWLNLSPMEIRKYVSDQPPLFAKSRISLPEIACFLSHVSIWRKIAVGPAPMAFVFEDDFSLEPGAVDAMSLLSESRPTWDMLKLHVNKPRASVGAEMTRGPHVIGTPTVLPSMTIAYAITRPAARMLAERCFPLRRPLDLYLKHWWEHNAAIKVIQPSLVSPCEEHIATSSIDAIRAEGKQMNHVSRFLRNLAYQAAFRFNMTVRAQSRPVDASWPDDEFAVGPVADSHASRSLHI